MEFEWWMTVVIIPITIGIWEFWNKKLWPYIQDSRVDDREHIQKLQEYATKSELLQSSWNDDKISTLLEESESFIREEVWNALQKILESRVDVQEIKLILQHLNKNIIVQNKAMESLAEHEQELHRRVMELIVFYRDKGT